MKFLRIVQFFSKRKLITLLPMCEHSGNLTRLLSCLFFFYEIHMVGAMYLLNSLDLFLVTPIRMHCFLSGSMLFLRKLNELLYLARQERPKSRKRREISRRMGCGDLWRIHVNGLVRLTCTAAADKRAGMDTGLHQQPDC